MKTVAFSDVHLPPVPGQSEEFVRFLHELGDRRVGRLVILGDLFDFWFEYRHVVFSGYFETLEAFAELRRQGVELHLVCGNHDFWAGRFLKEHLGFQVHPERLELELAGKRALLLHGDGVNRRDLGYRVYKHIARARLTIALFRLIHPDLAMEIARRVSRTSRRIVQARDPGKSLEAKALREFAKGVLSRGEAEIVVCGHAHAPALEEYAFSTGTGLYINTGDWLDHRSYVEWDGDAVRLLFARPQTG